MNNSSNTSLTDQLKKIGEQGLVEIETAQDLSELEGCRVKFLGKKGAFSEVLRGLATASAGERPRIGAVANEWKAKLESSLETKKQALELLKLGEQLKRERIDVSLPARVQHQGALHPVTQTAARIVQVLGKIGFDVTTGPEVETEFLNFEAVNIPKDHPARDMQDTFFVGPGVVLRTHTSAVQMREMLSRSWPVRVLCPGAVYRCDNDATHSPMFHQIEGLWVDKKVTMADLIGTLDFFAKELFGADAKIRVRPSYFPFVEPGVEVDVECDLGKGRQWLEILGAGMVHPELFKVAGYDPNQVSGFAFGVGVDRVAMLLHGIPDLRLMFQGDMRFATQF